MYISRVSLALHNEDKNKKFQKEMKKHFSLINVSEYMTAVPQKTGLCKRVLCLTCAEFDGGFTNQFAIVQTNVC